MDSVIQNIVEYYNFYFHEQTSPITRDWFLVGKPFQLLSILAFYFFFCTRLGPRFMKDRNPYDVTNFMKVYNVAQILLSLYIVYEATTFFLLYNFNVNCQGLDPDKDIARWVARGVWTYFMAKVSELLDTVLFVLRKSNRQITSLHLHHHILMTIAAWFGATYQPGGQAILIGYLNAFVHTIMYTYYLISGFGDKYKKHLWWKRHVTELQLVSQLKRLLRKTLYLLL
ncbi:elongation of very long chain fatty acids protein AAEL008004-like [Vanessa cardui]|uniref:elongation of very long chain fatty acids protein AAEL008004-like n=1 Tax=Vanessa cardui TaxID=171605 RepID=UPI001F12A4E1|nr:elongation of very long chain fatty acids protein AAEL008004-like [Vanessa cardui]